MWHSSYNLFSTVYTDMSVQLRAHQYKLLEKVCALQVCMCVIILLVISHSVTSVDQEL
jgi:hypothetical protein